MKRRILSLLLVLCMIVGLLPMIALAEDTEIAGTLKQFAITVDDGQQSSEGISWTSNLDRVRYALVAADGRSITWDGDANEDNYNIKVEQNANGLEITLNNAKLTRTANHVYGMRIRYEGKVTIRLIGNNVMDYTGITGKLNVPAAIYVHATEGATITGTGSLTAKGDGFANGSAPLDVNGDGTKDYTYDYGSVIEANCDLTIKDVTLDLDQVCTGSTDPWAGHGIRCSGDVTIDNANVDIYAQYGNGIHLGPTRKATGDGNLTITNGAKVKIVNDRASYAPIKIGTGNIYIDNKTGDTEVTLQGGGYAFNKTPVLDGSYTAYSSTVKDGTGATPYTAEGGQTAASGAYRYFQFKHVCVAGEPVVEKPVGDCVTSQDTVTYCTKCGEEVSRETVPVVDCSKIHTPGKRVEVDQFPDDDTKFRTEATKSTKGKYVFETTCAVCGETWTDEEEFGAAIFKFAADGAASASDRTWWNANDITPSVVMNPGEVKYFETKASTTEGYTENFYMAELTDDAKIADGQWQVKMEYPLYGTPVLTLKGANIKNNTGLWYGVGKYVTTAPLNIVVEEDSTIDLASATYYGNLVFFTSGDVTITGPGKLTLKSWTRDGRGLIHANGNIILDHANIDITKNDTVGGSNAGCDIIYAPNGNVTIKGGSFKTFGFHRSYSMFRYGIRAAKGNIIIEDGANVDIKGRFGGGTNGILEATAGSVTISDSDVLLAHGYLVDGVSTWKPNYADAINYSTALNLNYSNGFVAKTDMTSDATKADTGSVDTTYNITGETPVLTLPADSKLSTHTDASTLNNITLSGYFFQITPNEKLVKFEASSVTLGEDFDINFKYHPEELPTAATVKYTIDGVEYTDTLDKLSVTDGDDTFIVIPGLNAKQMATEITVAIYDADGKQLTEKKTDSVLAYALRQLRSETYADDTKEKNVNFKTLLVDMLAYGAMAQVQYCEYTMEEPLPYTELATSALTATEWGYASELKALDKENSDAVVSTDGYNATAFDLKKDIGMAVRLDAAVGATKATVTFTDYKGNEREETAVLESTDGDYIVFVFENMSASNGRQAIIWTFSDDNGTVLTVTDSLANYVARMVDDCPYLEELVKYCDSARTYFLDPIV